MLSMFLFIFFTSLLFSLIFILPISVDKGAALASILGFIATLYAAVVAYLLLDNWKEQHKANYYSEMGKNLINQLRSLNVEVLSLQIMHSELSQFLNSNRVDKDTLIKELKDEIFSKISVIHMILDKLMHEGMFYLKVNNNEFLKDALLDFHEEVHDLFIPLTNKINDTGTILSLELLKKLEDINSKFMKDSNQHISKIIDCVKKDSFL